MTKKSGRRQADDPNKSSRAPTAKHMLNKLSNEENLHLIHMCHTSSAFAIGPAILLLLHTNARNVRKKQPSLSRA